MSVAYLTFPEASEEELKKYISKWKLVRSKNNPSILRYSTSNIRIRDLKRMGIVHQRLASPSWRGENVWRPKKVKMLGDPKGEESKPEEVDGQSDSDPEVMDESERVMEVEGEKEDQSDLVEDADDEGEVEDGLGGADEEVFEIIDREAEEKKLLPWEKKRRETILPWL